VNHAGYSGGLSALRDKKYFDILLIWMRSQRHNRKNNRGVGDWMIRCVRTGQNCRAAAAVAKAGNLPADGRLMVCRPDYVTATFSPNLCPM
jgi:hypothetical protein